MIEIRTLIVDDEPLARRRLRRMLGQQRGIQTIGECADGTAALQAVEELSPDLLLLDIQMPGVDGFGVVEGLVPGPLPIIVFVTAFDEHSIHAFEACALDYLLKPVSPPRLAKTIYRVRRHLSAIRADPAAQTTATFTPMHRKFLVRSGQRTSFVSPEEIDWIEADGNYAILHAGGRNHLLRATMSALETDLPATFLRASRSSILNLRRVKEIQSSEGSHFAIMMDDTKAPLTCGVREIQQRMRSL